jgi:hypothetical protein
MSVAVEKLPMWIGALMGRSRELSPQLLNEPFHEVKAQMVRFWIVDGHFRGDLLACRQRVQLRSH